MRAATALVSLLVDLLLIFFVKSVNFGGKMLHLRSRSLQVLYLLLKDD